MKWYDPDTRTRKLLPTQWQWQEVKRFVFVIRKVVGANSGHSMPFWRKKGTSSCWQPKRMQPALWCVTASQKPRNYNVKFNNTNALHQPPNISHKERHEKLIDRRTRRIARLLQATVLQFWTLVDNWIPEVTNLHSLQCLRAIRYGQKTH